jgi:hypothetical protein
MLDLRNTQISGKRGIREGIAASVRGTELGRWQRFVQKGWPSCALASRIFSFPVEDFRGLCESLTSMLHTAVGPFRIVISALKKIPALIHAAPRG